MDFYWHLFFLLWPIGLGSFLCLLALFAPYESLKKKNHIVDAVLVLTQYIIFHYIDLQPFKAQLLRTFLIVGAIFLFLFPVMRDYSWALPSRYSIVVLFDEDGLRRSLSTLTAEEIRLLKIAPDWVDRRQKYFDNLNRDLLERGKNFQFSSIRGITVGKGRGLIRIDKTSWFFQRYKILEARGTLTFETPQIGEPDARSLDTTYELIENDSAYITQSLSSVFTFPSILALPEFRQYARFSRSNQIYNHILVAATKVAIPQFEIEQTIYLIPEPQGMRTPIGYAILSPEK